MFCFQEATLKNMTDFLDRSIKEAAGQEPNANTNNKNNNTNTKK